MLKRLWRIYKIARAIQRYTDDIPWDDHDARSLQGFLSNGTGFKMDAAMTSFILDQGQEVISKGGSAFDVGRVCGMKQLWVFMKTLSTVRVAPQDD